MKVYRTLENLPKFKNTVITIGSFDGVHQGHQKILQKVKLLAAEIDGQSVVITFHPHPREVIYPRDHSLQLLSTVEEKIQLFEKYGVDNLVIVPFTVEFSQLSPDEYIERFLMDNFKPKYIVIGYDHRFGLNRKGNIDYLTWYSKNADFEVVEIGKHTVDHIAISSSKIRQSLLSGHVNGAAKWLNHYYTLTGIVVKGKQFGTQIGYPTANIFIEEKLKLIPPFGIYAVHVIHKGVRYKGMLYIGKRPTVDNEGLQSIEVNIFDFNQEIYGDTIQLELVEFIRNDMKFDTPEALKSAIDIDKKNALALLSSHPEHEDELSAVNKKPYAAIVILNYNGRKFLKKFLPSVLGTAYSHLQIWVADNCSTDDSVNFLHTYYPNIQTISLDKNYGFAEGYNQALKQIPEEIKYYVLLNSDVEVTTNWLKPIIAELESDYTIAAVQPKILSFHQKSQFEYAGAAGGWLDYLGYPFCRGRILNETEEDKHQYDQNSEIAWATGAALIIRADLFHLIGGFDGDFFAHMEEIDLCWRLRRAGYSIKVEPKSVVYHVGGGTLDYLSPNKTYLNFRNSLMTLWKNEPVSKLLWLIPTRLVLDGVAGGLFLTRGQYAHIWAIFRAHGRFYRLIPKLIKKRNFSKRKVRAQKISEANNSGVFRGSIIFQFFIMKKRSFNKIMQIEAKN